MTPEARVCGGGHLAPSSSSCGACRVAKRVSGRYSTRSRRCLGARPGDPVSSRAPAPPWLPGPQLPAARTAPHRTARTAGKSAAAAAASRCQPGATGRAPARHLHPPRSLSSLRGLLQSRAQAGRVARPRRQLPERRATPLSNGFSGVESGGRRPPARSHCRGGACALHHRARLTCRRSARAGRACVQSRVCTRLGGWSGTAVGFSLPRARLSPDLGVFIFPSLLHPPLADLTFPCTQGVAASHPSTGANIPGVSSGLLSQCFPFVFLWGLLREPARGSPFPGNCFCWTAVPRCLKLEDLIPFFDSSPFPPHLGNGAMKFPIETPRKQVNWDPKGWYPPTLGRPRPCLHLHRVCAPPP